MGLAERDALSGTGFSREDVGCHASRSRVCRLAPSRLKPVPLWEMHFDRRKGFSREDVGWRAAGLRVCRLASSRLKPVPLWKCMSTVGLVLAWKASDGALQN
ncbi:hypothetical protein SAMN05216197_10918 [Pseudomonas graminis]|uniref:DUF1534 domain-containing protein n=1 Tax=Pseudomonas graminis TaxID=158627 RepID=A0A1I0CY35_9PSED|nr:hypothetical protein SAMN05216197_10918 [Pseudomonas graminis]